MIEKQIEKNDAFLITRNNIKKIKMLPEVIPERVDTLLSQIQKEVPFARSHRHHAQSLVLYFPKSKTGMLLSVPRDRDLSKVYCEPSIVLPCGALAGSPVFPLFFSSWQETLRGIFCFYFRYVCLHTLTTYPSRVYSLRSRKFERIPSLCTVMFYGLSTSDVRVIRDFEIYPSSSRLIKT